MKKNILWIVLLLLFASCEKDEPRGNIGSVEIKAYPIDNKVTFSVTAYAASNITVDWGDGTTEKFDVLSNFKHEYSNSEIQTIRITAETLTGLSVSYGNFEELKLRNCLDLKYLSCYLLNLKEIDIAEAKNLEELYCDDNQLTALDISKNTSLTTLECRRNQLTNLDLNNNTTLMLLYCEQNQLTSMEVSNCTALLSFDCSFNQLTSLEVNNCTALNTLSCGWNQLTSLKLIGNTNLDYIQCNDNQLTAATLNSLFESLPTLTYSGSIVIGENPGTLEADRLIATSKGWRVKD